MKPPIALIIFILIICECNLEKVLSKKLTTVGDKLDVIRGYGYPVEIHTAETEDGYLLQMHRIPHGIKNDTDPGAGSRKFPVFCQHGLLASSSDFVLLEPNKSLAFVLADLGFDVWLGNFRGNTYSRANSHISPNDKKFWNFSWHESGIYDLPAQIDYVLNATKTEKVIYIGYSMGTTTFFVMTSTVPEYNKKIELALLMAPVAYVKNMKSPLLRGLANFKKTLKFFDELLLNGEFLPNGKLMITTKFVCTLNKIERKLCKNIIFLITGCDPKGFDEDKISYYLNFYPAGYSVRGPYHYAQLLQSGEFQQYDYGEAENKLRYNASVPPMYNLSAITSDMIFYVGPNDYLGDPKDAKLIAKQLNTLKKYRMVNDTKFNHVDFLMGKRVKELLYDFMIKDINAHLNEQAAK